MSSCRAPPSDAVSAVACALCLEGANLEPRGAAPESAACQEGGVNAGDTIQAVPRAGYVSFMYSCARLLCLLIEKVQLHYVIQVVSAFCASDWELLRRYPNLLPLPAGTHLWHKLSGLPPLSTPVNFPCQLLLCLPLMLLPLLCFCFSSALLLADGAMHLSAEEIERIRAAVKGWNLSFEVLYGGELRAVPVPCPSSVYRLWSCADNNLTCPCHALLLCSQGGLGGPCMKMPRRQCCPQRTGMWGCSAAR